MGKNTGFSTNYAAKRIINGSCGGTTGNITCTTKALMGSTEPATTLYVNRIVYNNQNNKYTLFFSTGPIFWHGAIPTSVINITTGDSIQWQSYLSDDELSYYITGQPLLADGTYSIWWGNIVGQTVASFNALPSTFTVKNEIVTFVSSP